MWPASRITLTLRLSIRSRNCFAKFKRKLQDYHFINPVDFLEPNIDSIPWGCGNCQSSVISMHRAFPMPSIYKRHKTYHGWPAQISQRYQGSNYSSPGEEHIIHQNHFTIID